MSARKGSSILRAPLSVLAALVLSACAGPAAVATPTATPPLATETVLPPATVTVESPLPAVPGVSDPFWGVGGLAFDGEGNLYFTQCLADLDWILKLDQAGFISVFAGRGTTAGYSGDGGPALSAEFNCAGSLAFDRDGSLYVADTANFRIRKIDRGGIIRTVAGSGPLSTTAMSVDTSPIPGFSGDGGPAVSAKIGDGLIIALDATGNLYVADIANNRVRKVDRQGIITTIAGNGTNGFSGDGGPAIDAQFFTFSVNVSNFGLLGISVDTSGNIYVSDTLNYRIRKIDQHGTITTIAGNGESGYSGDGGPATAARLSSPGELAFDGAGNLYVSDDPTGVEDSNRVRRIDPNGIITTVAGAGSRGHGGDGGPALLAALDHPGAITFDSNGNLYIADTGNARIRKVDANGIISTVLGGTP